METPSFNSLGQMSAPLETYAEMHPTAKPMHLESVPPLPNNLSGEERDVQREVRDAEVAERIENVVKESLGGEQPDAIFAFSGGTIQLKSGRWVSTAFSHLSEHGLATGGRVRVLATAEIAKAIPGVPIVTDSYNQFLDKSEAPTMAKVMEEELVRRGVDAERIKKEEESISTVTQLIEMVKMTVAKGWKNVAVVGNYWHLPRTAVMFKNLETIVNYEDPEEAAAFAETLKTFREMDVNVGGVSSEDILCIAHPYYAQYLSEVDQSAGLQGTIAAEGRGLDALARGTYRVTLKPPTDLAKKPD